MKPSNEEIRAVAVAIREDPLGWSGYAADMLEALLAERVKYEGRKLLAAQLTNEMLEGAVQASIEAESIYDDVRPPGAWDKFGLRHNRIRHVYESLYNAAPSASGEGK